MPKVAILGASGYSGRELLRLLHFHPDFDVVIATSEQSAGQPLPILHRSAKFPATFRALHEVRSDLEGCDLVFSALPHGESASFLAALASPRIVDLSGDFRLQDPAQFATWYGRPHGAPHALADWVYGLPELYKADIQRARRVANPGCYATAAILGAAPLIHHQMVTSALTLIGASGASGAGHAPKASLHFSHLAEDVRPYKIAAHQHTPEIEQTLSNVASRHQNGAQVKVTFVPQLLPIVRGILMTVCAPLSAVHTTSSVQALFTRFYATAPAVRVVAEPPGTKEVRGAYGTLIHPVVDERTAQVVVSVVIDNLVKGAAGQAIHNANLLFQLPELRALEGAPFYP